MHEIDAIGRPLATAVAAGLGTIAAVSLTRAWLAERRRHRFPHRAAMEALGRVTRQR